ncbi:hypothetical protein CA11_05120 [Gimesia maris]|nr:hypothetical protein CA11_05120 [Gimesia maris]
MASNLKTVSSISDTENIIGVRTLLSLTMSPLKLSMIKILRLSSPFWLPIDKEFLA